MIDYTYFTYGTGLVLIGYMCGVSMSILMSALRSGSGGHV